MPDSIDLSDATARWLRVGIEAVHLGTWNYELAPDVVTCSSSIREAYGIPADLPLCCQSFFERVHPDDVLHLQEAIRRASDPATDGRYETEHRALKADGTERWIVGKGQTFFEGEGDLRKPHRVMVILVDVTERVRAEQKQMQAACMQDKQALNSASELRADVSDLENLVQTLRRQTTVLRAVLDCVGAGIIVADPQGELILVNAEAERLMASPGSSEQPENWAQRCGISLPFGAPPRAGDMSPLARALRGEKVDAVEISLRDEGQGPSATIAASGRPVYGPDGEMLGAVVALHNITELKRVEFEVRKLSVTDQLTGLANRRLFDSLLTTELARARRYDNTLGLIFADLDHFKRINDSFGHGIGDEILQGFAEIVRSQIRDTDVAARIGGEEFAVVLPHADLEQTWAAAERIRRALSESRLAGVSCVTASFGVAQRRLNDTVESIMKRADDALYAAKSDGRNCVAGAQVSAVAYAT